MVRNLHFPTATSEIRMEGNLEEKTLVISWQGETTHPTIAPAGARTHDLPHTQTSYQARSPTPCLFSHREALTVVSPIPEAMAWTVYSLVHNRDGL